MRDNFNLFSLSLPLSPLFLKVKDVRFSLPNSIPTVPPIPSLEPHPPTPPRITSTKSESHDARIVSLNIGQGVYQTQYSKSKPVSEPLHEVKNF